MVLIFLVYVSNNVFLKYPIDNNYSDVYAQVLSAASWLLNGEYPYQDVVLPSYTMHNTYLPMQWLPFVIPIAFDFDPRWIPITLWVFSIVSLVYFLNFNLNTKNFIIFFITTLSIVVGFNGYISKNPQEYSATLELLPSSYYILLLIFIFKRSWLGIGIAMGFCLLSRFSIVLLIPFLIYYIWQYNGKHFLSKSIISALITILLLFVLPFMSQDMLLPQKIVANYDNGAAGEWRVHEWQNEGDLPYQISRGVGLSIYFRDAYLDDLLNGVKILKRWGFALSLVCSIFFMFFLYRFKDKIDPNWFLLAIIKIYFTVFYTFVLIPYTYLFLIPLSISVFILIYSISRRSELY